MISSVRIATVLGGRGVLRERTMTYAALADRIRSGLPYAAIEALGRRLDIPLETLARVLRLPARTLARRKRERRLRADESDRLVRLGRIVALAEDVLGSRERGSAWLRAPNRALGGERPLERLDTDAGSRQVEQVLGRIAHGVYS